MASRCMAHALADVGDTAVWAAEAKPKSVVTPMAGFAATGSAPTPLAKSVTAMTVAPSASRSTAQERAGVAKSTPKSVVTALAGFAQAGPASASVAVVGGGSATGDPRPHKPGARTAKRWAVPLVKVTRSGAELDPALLRAAAIAPLNREARFDETPFRALVAPRLGALGATPLASGACA